MDKLRRHGLWLFASVYLLQLGHLSEHISMAIQGHGLLGPEFNTELSHFLFNGLIFLLATVMFFVFPRNPWLYPLVVVCGFHELEHCYIFSNYLRTGIVGAPGLLGSGGAIGVLPIARTQLHNIYNGTEVILLTLGLTYQTDLALAVWGRRKALEIDI